MSEIILGLIVLAVIVLHCWYVKEKNVEVNKLVNAIIAKNSTELRDLGMVDKVKPIVMDKPQPEDNPDLVPLSNLSQADFDEHIERMTNGS